MPLAPFLALVVLLDPRSVTEQFVQKAKAAEALIAAGKLAEACAVADELTAQSADVQMRNSIFLVQAGGADAVPLLAGSLFGAGQTGRARALLVAAAPLCTVATPAGVAAMKDVLGGDPAATWDVLRKCAGRGVTFETLEFDPATSIPVLEKRLEDGTATESEIVFLRDQLVLQRGLKGTLSAMRAAARSFPASRAVHDAHGDAAALEGETAEALAAFDAAAGFQALSDQFYESAASERIWMGFFPAMRRTQRNLESLVKLASLAAASGLHDKGVALVDAHAAQGPVLLVADAYFELGAHPKAAARYREWLKRSTRRQRGGLHSLLVAETVRRLIVCHVAADEPFQALLARRVWLPDFGSGPGHFESIGRILAQACDEALDPVRARAVPGEALMREFLAEQECTDGLRRRAREQVARLRSDDPAERQEATVELGRLGPGAAPALLDLVRGEDPEADGRLLQIVHGWATEYAEAKYREE